MPYITQHKKSTDSQPELKSTQTQLVDERASTKTQSQLQRVMKASPQVTAQRAQQNGIQQSSIVQQKVIQRASDELSTIDKTSQSLTQHSSAAAAQRMVAVAGGQQTFNKKDFTQLAHLDWAMKISGGPLVDLDASISAIGENEDLHLVQHGDKGMMVHQIKDSKQWKSIGAQQIATLFIQHLPQNYAGRIRVSSCYSGTLSDIAQQDSSLVGQIKNLIQSSKRADLHNVVIVGWNGPTITNININSDSGTGAETVNDKHVDAAGKLQDKLLNGKYNAIKTNWESKVGKDVRPLDVLAAAASKEFEAFYQEFAEECKKNGWLLDYVDSLVIA